jgi:hypothetical protein
VGIEDRHEVALALRGNGRGVPSAAHRVDGICQLGERALCDHLRAVDRKSRSTRGSDAVVDTIECRLAFPDPLHAKSRAARKLACAGDVAEELTAQSCRAGAERRGWRAVEIVLYGGLEVIARARHRMEIRAAAGLHVLADGTIKGHQLLE